MELRRAASAASRAPLRWSGLSLGSLQQPRDPLLPITRPLPITSSSLRPPSQPPAAAEDTPGPADQSEAAWRPGPANGRPPRGTSGPMLPVVGGWKYSDLTRPHQPSIVARLLMASLPSGQSCTANSFHLSIISIHLPGGNLSPSQVLVAVELGQTMQMISCISSASACNEVGWLPETNYR